MTDNPLQPSDGYTAWMIQSVVDATAPRDEPAAVATRRETAIEAMYRAFEPSNAMEAMFACQCILARADAVAAARDASVGDPDAKTAARLRSLAAGANRLFLRCIGQFRSVKAHGLGYAPALRPRGGASIDPILAALREGSPDAPWSSLVPADARAPEGRPDGLVASEPGARATDRAPARAPSPGNTPPDAGAIAKGSYAAPHAPVPDPEPPRTPSPGRPSRGAKTSDGAPGTRPPVCSIVDSPCIDAASAAERSKQPAGGTTASGEETPAPGRAAASKVLSAAATRQTPEDRRPPAEQSPVRSPAWPSSSPDPFAAPSSGLSLRRAMLGSTNLMRPYAEIPGL